MILKTHLFTTLFMAAICGLLIIWGSKTAIGINLLIILILVFLIIIKRLGTLKTNKYFLYFIIFTIPFPYIIQIAGQDALTLTTVMILLLLGILNVNKLVSNERIGLQKDFVVILPIVIIFGMTISFILNPVHIGQSFRLYLASLSGIGLYLLVYAIIKKPQDVIHIIRILLIALFIQFAFSFLQLKFPEIARKFIRPFGSRINTGYASVAGGIVRANAFIGDYELLAQMFFVGVILSICLIYIFRKKIYMFLLLCNLAGIVFTKTRSALMLLVFGFCLIFLLLRIYKKDYKWTYAKIIVMIILGFSLMLVLFPSQISDYTNRLNIYLLSEDKMTSEALNRSIAWEVGASLVERSTIFGQGFYKAQTEYSWAKSFHSLYLTILYQMGIFGLFAYSIFWLVLLLRGFLSLSVFKSKEIWFVIFFLFVSVTLMLIDGIKIEYLRYSHTIQFAWLIYALLAVTLKQNEKSNENIMVSST